MTSEIRSVFIIARILRIAFELPQNIWESACHVQLHDILNRGVSYVKVLKFEFLKSSILEIFNFHPCAYYFDGFVILGNFSCFCCSLLTLKQQKTTTKKTHLIWGTLSECPDQTKMSRDLRFPTMWYVCAVWLEPLLVAWIFYEC